MPPTFTLLRKNLWVRFDFGGGTVLLARCGHPESCYTTDGAWGGAFEGHSKHGIASIV
jgi:hypothetical protein